MEKGEIKTGEILYCLKTNKVTEILFAGDHKQGTYGNLPRKIIDTELNKLYPDWQGFYYDADYRLPTAHELNEYYKNNKQKQTYEIY